MLSIEERVKQIIADEMEITVEEISSNTVITDDLDADSLNTIMILVSIEAEFDIEIAAEEVEQDLTVARAIQMVEELS